VEYHPEGDFRTLILHKILQILYVKDLVKRLRRDLYLREACSYRDRPPYEAHFTQIKGCIGAEGF